MITGAALRWFRRVILGHCQHGRRRRMPDGKCLWCQREIVIARNKAVLEEIRAKRGAPQQ